MGSEFLEIQKAVGSSPVIDSGIEFPETASGDESDFRIEVLAILLIPRGEAPRLATIVPRETERSLIDNLSKLRSRILL